MMGVLTGKTAIITGGASGQGAEEARLFVAEGACVVLTDLNPAGAKLAAELGDKAHFVQHDVSRQSDWKNVVDQASARFGAIDILVNNAGIVGFEPIETLSAARMQKYLDTHVMGALFGIQAVVPHMPASGGSIVNIASVAAIRGIPSLTGYGTSKWALRGLSRYAAQDLAHRHIRVNCVLPGGVDTPMIVGDNPELIDAVLATVPMRRYAQASEIAKLVLFLASDQSSYMTGSEIVADGGQNA